VRVHTYVAKVHLLLGLFLVVHSRNLPLLDMFVCTFLMLSYKLGYRFVCGSFEGFGSELKPLFRSYLSPEKHLDAVDLLLLLFACQARARLVGREQRRLLHRRQRTQRLSRDGAVLRPAAFDGAALHRLIGARAAG